MTLLDIWSLIEYVKGNICAVLEVFFAMSSARPIFDRSAFLKFVWFRQPEPRLTWR